VTSSGRFGPFENRSDGLDGALVDLAIFGELREVVDEPRMNDRIRGSGAAAQAFGIFE
jgi:hypothetical protein